MGGCLSTEAPAPAPAGAGAAAAPRVEPLSAGPQAQQGSPTHGRATIAIGAANGAANPAPAAAAVAGGGPQVTRPPAPGGWQPASSQGGDAAQGYALLRQMAVLSAHPLLALMEAAELIVEEGAADVAGVVAYPPDDEACAVLLAAFGEGGLVMERRVVMRGAEWSAGAALAAPGWRLSVPDAYDPDAAVPADLALLRDECGLAAFEVAPVCPPAGAPPLGALIVGRRQAGGFGRGGGSSLPPQLAAATTGLLQLLRQSAVSEVARLLVAVNEAEEPVAAITSLLRGTAQYMLRATNLPMVVRLALIPREAGTVRVVIFELRPDAGNPRRRSVAGDGGGADGEQRPCEVSVAQMDVSHTLLACAAAKRQAITIKDTTSYLQNCGAPPRDMFTHSHESCSVAVVPLMHGDDTLGALYFSPSDPNDFSNIQDTLVGFVAVVGPSLSNRLLASADKVNALVAEAKRASFQDASAPLPTFHVAAAAAAAAGSAAAAASGSTAAGAGAGVVAAAAAAAAVVGGAMDIVPLPPVSESEADSVDDGSAALDGPLVAAAGAGGALGAAPPGPTQLAVLGDRRLATEAMMKILQRDIRPGRRASMELSFMSDLTLVEAIGRGGYGTVYRGTYRSLPAAVKVMNARAHDGDAVSDAMELAVLSSVGHPNIVQLLAGLTDMVAASDEEARLISASFCGAGPAGPGAPPALPRFRRLLRGEGRDVPTFNVAVLEYCDGGTLRNAVKAGSFHVRLQAGGPIHVNLTALVDVLLDVATALQYLHEVAGLVHGDIKLDNILLKSDPARPLGATAKLSDFGLAKVVSGEASKTVVNRTGAGTLTHLAPEMLRAGTTVTTGIDTYAFGVMMWELYTAKRAYAGLTPEAITQRVLHQGCRLAFPPGAPPAYADLAASCWRLTPGDRPGFADVVRSLRQQRATLAPPSPQHAQLAQHAQPRAARQAATQQAQPAAPPVPPAQPGAAQQA